MDPVAAGFELPLKGTAPVPEGEGSVGFKPALLAFLPVSFGDVIAFSALKKSFLSIYGLDFPLPRGSRSVKRPVMPLEVFVGAALICCDEAAKGTLISNDKNDRKY